MFVRVNTITGAENIDAGVAYLQDKVIPELAGQKGFRGLTASGNRSTAEFGILGLWDTRQALEASDSVASKLRQEAMKTVGGQVSVTIMEQMVAEVVAPRTWSAIHCGSCRSRWTRPRWTSKSGSSGPTCFPS